MMPEDGGREDEDNGVVITYMLLVCEQIDTVIAKMGGVVFMNDPTDRSPFV